MNCFPCSKGVNLMISPAKNQLKTTTMSTTTEETTQYARKCDVTGKGMNKGYCIQDGEKYIHSHLDMLQHITDETDYKTIDEAYEDDYYYYTEWFDSSFLEDGYYNKLGEHFPA